MSMIKALTHVRTYNQNVQSHSALFVKEDIVLVYKLLPNNQALVFTGDSIVKINLTDVVVGRLTVEQLYKRKGVSMSVEIPYFTDVHHKDYNPLLALAKNNIPFTGKKVKTYATIHPKNVVQVSIEKLVKLFPSKTGEELTDAIGLVTKFNPETNLYSVMIFETTILAKREDLIRDDKRNSTTVYCLSDKSRQVGQDLLDKAISEYESAVATVEKPKKVKAKPIVVEKEETIN